MKTSFPESWFSVNDPNHSPLQLGEEIDALAVL
jgi:hypothetical protein